MLGLINHQINTNPFSLHYFELALFANIYMFPPFKHTFGQSHKLQVLMLGLINHQTNTKKRRLVLILAQPTNWPWPTFSLYVIVT
jgi:hypothetical protein